jgi:hypothetical protein
MEYEAWIRECITTFIASSPENVLHEKGCRAVAPALSPLWERKHALSNR